MAARRDQLKPSRWPQSPASRSSPELSLFPSASHAAPTPLASEVPQQPVANSHQHEPSSSIDSSASSAPQPRSRSSSASSTASYSSSASASSSSRSPTTVPLPRTRSTPYLTSFAPPFYNRPPTPLPPSPSLTSLLRPTFSAAPSRPTTPDESDTDAVADAAASTTEAAVARSARAAPTPIARVAPKVPTYEYYGFVLYVTSSLCFLLYLLWAYLPAPFLHLVGIHYYPNRWWALALPAWLAAALAYAYVALAAYNAEVLTRPVGALGNVVDGVAQVAALDRRGRIVAANDAERRKGEQEERMERGRGGGKGKGKKGGAGAGGERRAWAGYWSEGTDAVMDVPVGGVCEILYGDG